MSEKKIRKMFVNRSLPVEVAELIDEIHSDNELNRENLSKSGLVGKALLEYKNKKLNQMNEQIKSNLSDPDTVEETAQIKKIKNERRNIHIW
jgi:arsenate reductase-like glutaredoxin family protein